MDEEMDIYKLKLNESVTLEDGWYVTRVPGGWIYKLYSSNCLAVFVPFNNEFQEEMQIVGV
ncbi:MAG: hypothetical protein PHX80_04075 [Candidatus Nanoarchaeia archaeon]|nr:hypothetical protein [Candidatus Nanoarchaeia archaeon]